MLCSTAYMAKTYVFRVEGQDATAVNQNQSEHETQLGTHNKILVSILPRAVPTDSRIRYHHLWPCVGCR